MASLHDTLVDVPPTRPKAAEILAHHSYKDAVWKLKPTQSGKLDVAKDRGGPIGISWEVHGKGEKKIVFVVGLGGVKWAYQRQTLHFGHERGDEFSVLVLDNRGIGKSDKPILRYSTSEMAKDIIELLGHLSWTSERQLNVVGVSMGGMIAQELGYLIPTRINSLSLFSTAPYIVNTTSFLENFRQRLQMFVPKSLDKSLVNASGTMFPPHWLDEADNAKPPTSSSPNVEFPADGEYKKFATNYERWAAQELTKKTDPTQFGKKGFMLQAVAAGWHHKSAEQLKKMGDEIGRERIAVVHGDVDKMITVWHGKKLMELLEPEVAIVKERVGHVFFMEETEWHDKVIEERFERGYELNKKASL